MNQLQSPIPPLLDRTLDFQGDPPSTPPARYPAFLHHTLSQIAHRAVSLAVWLLAGRIVVACWPRNFEFTVYLLPAALACLLLAVPAAFLSFCMLRHRRASTGEPRGLLWISIALLAPTLIWMFLPQLSAGFFKLFPFLRG